MIIFKILSFNIFQQVQPKFWYFFYCFFGGFFVFCFFVFFFFLKLRLLIIVQEHYWRWSIFSVYLYGRIIFIWYSMVANSKFICKTIRSCIVSNSALIFWSTFCKYMFSYKWSESLYAKGSYPHVFPWPLGIAFPALWKRLFYGNPLTFPNHAPSTTDTYIA